MHDTKKRAAARHESDARPRVGRGDGVGSIGVPMARREDAMARATLDMDPMLADPLGELKRAREVGWLADLQIDAVGVLTHERVRELLADGRLHANFVQFMERFGITSGPFYEWMAISPLNRDGADHLRWRQLMVKTFTPRSVERLRPFLRDMANELIDGFAERGACEFMAEFADAYPSLGLCELIGVPAEDRDRFRAWANTIGYGFSPVSMFEHIREIDDALVQLLEYTGALAARRRAEPRDDLVTRIAQAAEEEGGYTDFEVRGFIAGLVFAGHETTKNQLGWMVALLAQRRDVWDGVAAGTYTPEEIVEEVMRHRGAATNVGRTVTEPVEIDGERLEPGTQILMSLWSANHDETAFARPDEIAPRQNDAPHVGFGYGPHHCIGAALARAELQEALTALTARLECPTVGEGAVWKPPLGITGPERLSLTFARRARRGQ
jgi:cytochrome P450